MSASTARRIAAIDERLDQIRNEEQSLRDERKLLEDQFIKYVEDSPDIVPDKEGRFSMTVGGRTVYLAHETWASVPKELRKAAAARFGRAGLSDLVDRTNINGQTLSAWVRERPVDKDGKPVLPPSLREYVKVSQPIKVKTRKR